MRGFLTQLVRLGGKIAMEHFRCLGDGAIDRKGRNDYVTHVDRRVEDAVVARIRSAYPDHRILGEEGQSDDSLGVGPLWIIDPIDGTTNFIRGRQGWAISICFCDDGAQARHAAVYDPVLDELFIAERGAGIWFNEQRSYCSGCRSLDAALVASALPFKQLDALADIGAVTLALQRRIDDMRRVGSAALDCAQVAVGRADAYWELGIWPWDTAAGELLVRCGGGVATDLRGQDGDLLDRRSIVCAATPDLHAALRAELSPLIPWLARPPYKR